MTGADVDFDALLHVEQSFYDAGYADGHTHGRLHGLIEGRALGRDKGYELWEEIGFYEGFAKFWQQTARASDSRRTESHLRHLLDLVGQFPATNPNANDPLDIAVLLNQIRARYKATCASLGLQQQPTGISGDAETKKTVTTY